MQARFQSKLERNHPINLPKERREENGAESILIVPLFSFITTKSEHSDDVQIALFYSIKGTNRCFSVAIPAASAETYRGPGSPGAAG